MGSRRAGKRKNRMGTQQLPAAAKPIAKLPTIVQDNLPPAESVGLELQALVKGWLNEDPAFADVRRALIQKVAAAGLTSADPNLMIRALRAIAQTEQRTKQLQLAAYALAMRNRGDLPEQIVAGQQQAAEPAVLESKPFQIIQELISRNDVRAAIDSRPAHTA